MRDALSLLDQVIAFGGAKLTAADTRMMLGTLDRTQVFGIVEALVARDAKRVLASVEVLDKCAPDYREVLADLAAVLQKLARCKPCRTCSSTRPRTSDVRAPRRRAESRGRAAVLPDRDRRPARPGACTRRARRFRDDSAAHAGVQHGRRCAGCNLRAERRRRKLLQRLQLRRPRLPNRRRPRRAQRTIGRRWSRR